MSKDKELIRHPLRVTFCEVCEDFTAMCCPVCGITYVHPAKVVVEQGSTKTVVDHEATSVQATDRGEHHRGSKVTLAFWCEGGHRFEYRMDFHKGQLFCELVACYSGQHLTGVELWRN